MKNIFQWNVAVVIFVAVMVIVFGLAAHVASASMMLTDSSGGGPGPGPAPAPSCPYANATCRTVALDVSCKENIYATVNGQSEQDACTASSNANNAQTVSNGGTSYNAPCRGINTYSFDPRTSLLQSINITSVGYDDSGSAGTLAGSSYYAWDSHNAIVDCGVPGDSCSGRTGTSCAGKSISPKNPPSWSLSDPLGRTNLPPINSAGSLTVWAEGVNAFRPNWDSGRPYTPATSAQWGGASAGFSVAEVDCNPGFVLNSDKSACVGNGTLVIQSKNNIPGPFTFALTTPTTTIQGMTMPAGTSTLSLPEPASATAYTVTVTTPPAGYNPTQGSAIVSPGGMGTITLNFIKKSPTPLSCTASTSLVAVDESVIFTAAGGSETYQWPDGTHGLTYSTSSPQAGNINVQVYDYNDYQAGDLSKPASCLPVVTVSGGSHSDCDNTNACVSVPGAGANVCSSSADCRNRGPAFRSTGSISASPNPCTIGPGQSMCASNISWSTKDAVDPQVYLENWQNTTTTGGMPPRNPSPLSIQFFGSGAEGTTSAPYIGIFGPNVTSVFVFVDCGGGQCGSGDYPSIKRAHSLGRVTVLATSGGNIIPPVSGGSGSLTINGSTSGSFLVGQSWTLQLTSSNENSQPFSLCATGPRNPSEVCSAWGTTSATGAWSQSGSFVAGDIGSWSERMKFADGVTTNNVNFSLGASHLGCLNGSCAYVAGAGGNTEGCVALNASCSGGPVTHLACVNNACTSVNGAGVSTCSSSADCGGGVTHLACVNNACTSVNGAGVSDCSACPGGPSTCISTCQGQVKTYCDTKYPALPSDRTWTCAPTDPTPGSQYHVANDCVDPGSDTCPAAETRCDNGCGSQPVNNCVDPCPGGGRCGGGRQAYLTCVSNYNTNLANYNSCISNCSGNAASCETNYTNRLNTYNACETRYNNYQTCTAHNTCITTNNAACVTNCNTAIPSCNGFISAPGKIPVASRSTLSWGTCNNAAMKPNPIVLPGVPANKVSVPLGVTNCTLTSSIGDVNQSGLVYPSAPTNGVTTTTYQIQPGKTATYSLVCTNSAGSYNANTTVTVVPPGYIEIAP